MPFDQAPKIETSHRPNWEMPEMTGINIRAAEYHPRSTRHPAAALPAVKDAVEIVVTFKAPPPARALSPVLYVGETRLTESEKVDKEGKELRFWAFDRSKLREGAPIEVRWLGEALSPAKGERGKPSRFTFTSPK